MPPSDNPLQREELKRLLARVPVIRSACDLDLLAFLQRHPRTLLTGEQLAELVGYNLKDIAKALDAFIEARLLGRISPQSRHAARMFQLLLDGPDGGPVKALLDLARTRAGRQAILKALNGPEPSPASGAGPELRLA